MKPLIVCLMGHTASGKTECAVKLVQKFPFEIISVDAAMVYQGMDIGTATPDENILKIAPHRLINLRDPTQTYSAGQFCSDAVREIEDIITHGKIPLLVGGTLLYFHTLQQGLSVLPEKNIKIRNEINEQAKRLGWPALHKKLSQIDPSTANRIHANDTQRISRALEIYQITQQPWSTLLKQRKPYLPYPILNLGLWMENRPALHQRIEKRFDDMLEHGWILEVKKLLGRSDLSEETPAMRSVGYRQILMYLNGELTFDEMREKGIIATRQLAKRQMTWMRKFKNLQRVNGDDLENIWSLVSNACS
jgi:tRNA dimethylallyltransferase